MILIKIASWFYCLIHLCNRNVRIGAMGLCFLLALIATYLFKFLHNYFHKKLMKWHFRLINSFVVEIYWPTIISIWLWALYMMIGLGSPDPSMPNADIIFSKISLNAFTNTQYFLTFIWACWFFLSLVNLLEKFLVHVKSVKKSYAHIIGRSLRLIGVLFIFLLVLPKVGIDTSRVWAFGGGSAVLIGLTVQPILRNYLGGLTIYSDNLFEENDFISLPEKKIKGMVKNIGWRSTFLEQLDGSPIVIPNDIFYTVSVVNIARQKVRKVAQTLTIQNENFPILPTILSKIRAYIDASKNVDHGRLKMVNMLDSSAKGLEITIIFYIKSKSIAKYRMIWEKMFFDIMNIIMQEGGKINQPLKEIHVEFNAASTSFF